MRKKQRGRGGSWEGEEEVGGRGEEEARGLMKRLGGEGARTLPTFHLCEKISYCSAISIIVSGAINVFVSPLIRSS